MANIPEIRPAVASDDPERSAFDVDNRDAARLLSDAIAVSVQAADTSEVPVAALFVAALRGLGPGAWNDIIGVCWNPVRIFQRGDSDHAELWGPQAPQAVAINVVAELQLVGTITEHALADAVTRVQTAGIRAAAGNVTEHYDIALSIVELRRTPKAALYGLAARQTVADVARADLAEHVDIPCVRAITEGTWRAIGTAAGVAAESLSTDMADEARYPLLLPFAPVL